MTPLQTMARRSPPALEVLETELVTLIRERLLETQGDFDAGSDLYENGLDSMAMMQLLVLIEEEYGVAIPEADLTRHNFSTARQLAKLIRERCARAA